MISISNENSLLQKIIDFSYDGIFITDAAGNILYFNDAYLRISGLKEKDISGKTIQSLVNNAEIPDACSHDVITTKKPVTKVIDYVNGVCALVTSIPVFAEHGRLIRVFSNVRDITDLMRLKEEVNKTSELNNEYRQMLWKRETGTNNLVANSLLMENIIRLAVKVAQVNSPILLQGESGVGKDVLAHFIHNAQINNKLKPFIHVNCSAIPENLLESELFGYEPGAFTGAAKNGKRGLFELANGGTLFLDEIAEMPMNLQVKLLDVLQNNKLYRLGGTKVVEINTRIISATNNDLEELIEKNKFRKDLYYRLNVIPIFIPPLRERKEDIVPLIFHFIKIKNKKFGFNKKISSSALEVLTEYNWPGNIRELKNVIERMVVLAEDNLIDVPYIPNYIKETLVKNTHFYSQEEDVDLNLKAILNNVEKEVIKKALSKFKTLRSAASHLGIDLSTLVRKKKKYKL